MKKLEKLIFSVSLLDKVSSPISKINSALDKLQDSSGKAFQQIGLGIAGLAGSAMTLSKGMQPALDMNAKLGELASLDVSNDSLDILTQKALHFSQEFGDSASDFVGSAYDIQSSIEGINGTQLANITGASATLAKATKSDAATITNYMGTMYGVFKNQAKQMGVDKWAEQVAGMTATSVKMFKTTGSGMAAAFGNLGAEATSMNVAMNEQMAVLGRLQSTMTGAEAGTKYKAFLSRVGKAQKELGLTFVDTHGKMLPMPQILAKISDKYLIIPHGDS